MGKSDNWSYIQTPKIIFDQVTELLKNVKFQNKSFFKPKDITLELLREFLKQPDTILKKIDVAKLEKHIIELEKSLQKMTNEKERIEKNRDEIIKVLISERFKPSLHGFDETYVSDLRKSAIGEKYIRLFNDEYENYATVFIKNKKLVCSEHKNKNCNHKLVAINNTKFRNQIEKYKVKIPKIN